MLVIGPNDFFQARQRSLQVRLRIRERIHFLCVSTVQHAQYGEIERDYGRSEDNLWMAVVEGGTASQRSCSFKDWIFSRPLALRPIYWEISGDAYTYFKIEYETELNTDIWRAPIPNSGLDRQRSQKNLGWNSTQTAEVVDGIRVLRRVGNKKRIGIDSLY